MLLPVYQIRFSIFGLPFTLLEAMILILFFVWLVKSWQAKELTLFNRRLNNINPYPLSREIILLLVIALISTVVAGFSNSALGILKAYFIEPIMFFVVFVNVFSAQGGPTLGWKLENRNKIFWALSISALVVSLVAIYQRITGNLMPAEWINSGRVTGVFNYPNALGLYLGPIVLVLSGWFLKIIRNSKSEILNPKQYQNTKYKITNIFTACYALCVLSCAMLAIYFAKSEGALIGVAAALFIFGLMYNKRSRRAVVGIAIIVVLIFSFYAHFRDFAVKKILLRDLDGQIRRRMWAETWEMLKKDGVIFGVGLANYQASVAPHHQEGIFVRDYNDPDFQRKVVFNEEYKKQAWQPLEIYLYPHNIFLNFWVELGLAGMLLFVWIIIKLQVTSYKLQVTNSKNREIILGLFGAMIVITVHGLVDAPYFKNDLAILFWVLAGMVGIMNLENTSQINKSITNNTNKWRK
jgi:O-antigen ligase